MLALVRSREFNAMEKPNAHSPLWQQVQCTTHFSHLRRASTPAECLLWQLVRNRKLFQAKFPSQHKLGTYFLNFYCPAACHTLLPKVSRKIEFEPNGLTDKVSK